MYYDVRIMSIFPFYRYECKHRDIYKPEHKDKDTGNMIANTININRSPIMVTPINIDVYFPLEANTLTIANIEVGDLVAKIVATSKEIPVTRRKGTEA